MHSKYVFLFTSNLRSIMARTPLLFFLRNFKRLFFHTSKICVSEIPSFSLYWCNNFIHSRPCTPVKPSIEGDHISASGCGLGPVANAVIFDFYGGQKWNCPLLHPSVITATLPSATALHQVAFQGHKSKG